MTPQEIADSFPPIPDELADRLAALMVVEERSA